MRRASAADKLAFEIRALGLDPPEREFAFHRSRKWRFDLAWPKRMLAVEVEGFGPRRRGAVGRHQSPRGFQADLDKYNAAVLDGWKVLRFSSDDVKTGRAINLLEECLSLPGTRVPRTLS